MAAIFCSLEGQKLKIWLGNWVNRIQHALIMLKSEFSCFFLKMQITVTCIRNLSSLQGTFLLDQVEFFWQTLSAFTWLMKCPRSPVVG